MQGLVWDGTQLEVAEDLQVRPPSAGEVLVGIRAAGLCHSDLKPMDADIPQPLPVVLGHEAAGVVVAALLGCAVITAFGAVEERARVRAGDSVMVIGAGGIGLNVIQAARLAGAGPIVVFDQNRRKEAIARRLGATDVEIGVAAGEIEGRARQFAPDGFDASFECVGRADLLAAAIRALAFGGRAVIVGLPPAGTRLELEIRSLFRDQALLGCRMGSVDPHVAIPRLVELYRSGQLILDPLITKVVPLTAGAALVQDLRDGALDRGVLDVAGVTVVHDRPDDHRAGRGRQLRGSR